jgi:ribonuclease D
MTMAEFKDPGQIQAVIPNHSTASLLWVETEVADYKTRNPRLSLIQILVDTPDNRRESVDFQRLRYPHLNA